MQFENPKGQRVKVDGIFRDKTRHTDRDAEQVIQVECMLASLSVYKDRIMSFPPKW